MCCCAHDHDVNCVWVQNYAFGDEEQKEYFYSHNRHVHYCNCERVFCCISIFFLFYLIDFFCIKILNYFIINLKVLFIFFCSYSCILFLF